MKWQIFFFVLISILLLVGGPASGSADANSAVIDPLPLPVWQHEVLLPGTDFHSLVWPSLALDPDGNPHIVYGSNHLFHAWFDGLGWQSETIDRSSGWNRESALVINDSGTIYVAHFNNRDLFLRILEPGGSWQTVRAPFLRVGYLCILLDSDGSPHIITGPDNNEFIHALYAPDGWAVERIVVDSPEYVQFSAVLDSNDRPVILYEKFDLYHDRHDVLLVRYKGQSWQNDLLGEGCMRGGSSLAVDEQDKAHAVFSEFCDETLAYAYEDSQGWEMALLTDDGGSPSLALDDSGRAHVVYGSAGGQVYAILEGGSWATTLVQAGENAGVDNTLLLDSAGAAHVSSIGPELQYATNKSGQWQVSTPAVRELFGLRNALAMDEADRMHILYHKLEAEELYWTSGSGSNWETELLAETPAFPLELAIDVDMQGRPHVAFTNVDKGNLEAGLRQDRLWDFEVLASGAKELSMAVDSMDRPHLAAIKDGVLYYWTRQGGVWTGEVVGEVNAWLGTAWLALDSQDRPHVAYSDSNGAFLASRQSANNWTKETLPFASIEKMVFGPDDRPYFLYVEERWESYGRYEILWVSLWFAEPDGQDWSVKWLWEDEYWDRMSDIAVAEGPVVHIALRSDFGGLVYYQRDESGEWRMEKKPLPILGDISMEIAQDGQPRVLWHGDGSLSLAKREILWLDKFQFLPVLVP